jgi:outer membrane receptor protein involved in Fe transport
MKKLIEKIGCTLIVLFVCFQSFAQNEAVIVTGNVIDETSQPVVGAVVRVLEVGKETSNIGTASDAQGNFELKGLANGSYVLKIEFVGYQFQERNFVISADKQMFLVGKIQLLPDGKLLQSVEIKAQKDLVETEIGKRTYNVGKDIITQGGTATDVLQNIPSVQVDENQNITFRGSSNVTVFINGKQSGITGASRQAVLSRIPASSIESIEIITNPSAKYDADASGGIINIVLKKSQETGLNGSVGATASNYDRFNATLDLNYKQKKFNIYGSVNGNQGNRISLVTTSRQNFLPLTTPIIDQSRLGEGIKYNYLAILGTDFYLNDKNTLTLEANIGQGLDKDYEILKNNNLQQDRTPIDNFNRISDERTPSFNGNYSLTYIKKFAKPRKELRVSGSFTQGEETKKQDFLQLNYQNLVFLQDSIQRSNTKQENRLILAQVDFVQPINPNWRFETGYKLVDRQVQTDFLLESLNKNSQVYENNTNFSNLFKYNESVHAGYGLVSGKYKGWELEFGTRLEFFTIKSDLVTLDSVVKNDYFNIFPNLGVLRKLPNNQEVKFTYSRKINRPGFGQLNPFPSYSNPLTLRSGNPNLRPEYVDALEVGYLKDWTTFTLTSALFYRYTTNVIQQVVVADNSSPDKNVLRFYPTNLRSSLSYGFELIGSFKPKKWVNVNADFSLYRIVVDGTNLDDQTSNDQFSWNTRINTIFTLPKQWRIQALVAYRAPVATAQGTRKDMIMSSIGVSKNILKDKATVTLRIGDPFKLIRFGSTFATQSYNSDFNVTSNTRTYTVGFTYRFGEQQRKQRKSREDGGDNGGGGDF